RVRAARVLPAQCGPGAQPGAHRAARLGRQLRHLHERDRRLRQLPATEDRRRLRAQAHPYGPRRGLRAARPRAVTVRPWPRSLRARPARWSTAALGALLLVRGGAALLLLDRGLRRTADASLESLAQTVAQSSRSPQGGLADALAAVLGPGVAERFFQLLDPLGRPDPRLAPSQRLTPPLDAQLLPHARPGAPTVQT